MAPVDTKREMPVTVMVPHVVMMPVTAARMMPVPSTFDLNDGLAEIIRISLRNPASQRKGIRRHGE